MLSVSLLVTSYVVARRRSYTAEVFPGFRAIAVRLVAAISGLLLVSIIFGGIRAGIFTAVWSASIAVVHATVVTGLIYRHMCWSAFKAACPGAARTSGAALFIIGCAGAFGRLMAWMRVATMMVDLLQALTDNPILILLMINVILRLNFGIDLITPRVG